MKLLSTASIALIAMASSALAAGGIIPQQPTPVPEISALEGTAAIAALAAIVLVAWERRRRAV